MLKTLLGTSSAKRLATDLYAALSVRAREPVFFAALGVPDTIDGRFDMVVLHAWLVLERLRQLQMKDASQAFVNLLFVSFDESLRDLGVGDIGIGHRVKKMADAFYGRLSAYGAADGQAAMEQAIRRNVYRAESGLEGPVAALSNYVRSAQVHMAGCDLSNQAPDFGPLPVPAG
jgi:cytochrome b pre-mRNA-processing protein 3